MPRHGPNMERESERAREPERKIAREKEREVKRKNLSSVLCGHVGKRGREETHRSSFVNTLPQRMRERKRGSESDRLTEPIVGRLWFTTRQRLREQASERVSRCERQGVRKRENERENLLPVLYGHNMTESDRASKRESKTAREQESKRA